MTKGEHRRLREARVEARRRAREAGATSHSKAAAVILEKTNKRCGCFRNGQPVSQGESQ